ncbi:MAG: hypothetical protein WBD40_15030 [Tepidisphaeraceae bacterium]
MASNLDDRPTWRRFAIVALPPFILAVAATLACYLAAGTGLMLYLGGIALAMLLTPPLVLAYRDSLERLLVAASIVDGVGLVWFVAMLRSETMFAQWLGAYILAAGCVFAMTGLALGLSRLLRNDVLASALCVVIALAWLTWPVWLSAWVDRPGVERLIAWLVPVHPLLAANGLLSHLGVWGEQRLMYQLTSLGQDVPYQFPATVVPATLAHALVGGALLLVARRGRHVGAAIDVPNRQAG